MTYCFVVMVGEGPNQRIIGIWCDRFDAQDGYKAWCDLTRREDKPTYLKIPFNVAAQDPFPQWEEVLMED